MDEKQKMILRIMQLAYLVHELTEYCVFIRFSGHVHSLEIDIRESVENWERVVMETQMRLAYRKHRDKGEEFAYYKCKIDVLEQILKDGEVDLSELEYEDETIRSYYF